MKTDNSIVFVNQALGYLTIDIINAFASEFNNIAVIYGDIRVQDIALNKKVIKSKIIEKSRLSNFKRLTRWLIATIQIYFLLITKYKRYEIFFFSVPPFAYLLSLLMKRKFSVLMWDVYPDALKMININESNLIFKVWEILNKRIFKKAFRVITIGKGLKDQLNKYVEKDNIKVINLWSSFLKPQRISKENNPFIEEYNLKDKFVVQYSGNIGKGHNIEIIIEVADKLINNSKIIFVIIGRGYKYKYVQEAISKRKLKNILLLPFLGDDKMIYSLSAADIGIVLLDSKISQISIPSKIYNMIAIETPILSISPSDSDISNLINKYEVGINFEENNIDSIKEYIQKISSDKKLHEKYSFKLKNARRDFTKDNANKIMLDYINN